MCTWTMGFGSYDESEQERQQFDSDDVETDAGVDTSEAAHEGSIQYEIDASADELLDKLEDIKDS